MLTICEVGKCLVVGDADPQPKMFTSNFSIFLRKFQLNGFIYLYQVFIIYFDNLIVPVSVPFSRI